MADTSMTRLLSFVTDKEDKSMHDDFAHVLLKKSNVLLHMLALQGKERALNVFADFGAKLDVRLRAGGEMLHTAARGGHHKVVLLLLAQRAQVGATFHDRIQPIHFAAASGHSTVVSLLLRHGAQIEAQCGSFSTRPVHMAAYHGHCGVLRTLLGFGAGIDSCDKDGGQVIHWAAAGGHCRVISTLLQRGAQPNAKAPDGVRPMHSAAASGRTDALRLLVRSRANVHAETWNGAQPIHAAAGRGNCAAVLALLELRARVDAARQDGTQPVHVAALQGARDVLLQLLDLGVPVDAQRRDGMQPIHDAASRGHREVVRLLLEQRASLQAKCRSGEQPIHAAAFFGHHEVVTMMMERRAQVERYGLFGAGPMHFAAFVGDSRLVVGMLESRFSVDPRDEAGAQPIHWASARGHYDTLSVLLEHKAPVDASTYTDGRQPIHAAVIHGHLQAVMLMLEHGAHIDALMKDGIQPVHLAAGFGHTDLLLFLLRAHAAHDAQSVEGQPVFWATGSNHSNALNVLMQQGGTVNAIRQFGPYSDYQPIHQAATKGHCQIVAELLKQRANVKAEFGFDSETGFQPVHAAAYSGHCQMVSFLMEHKASVCAQCSTAWQPIHAAAAAGQVDVVMWLLDHRAHVETQNTKGEQAVHMAVAAGRRDLVMALLDRGACVDARRSDGWQPIHVAAQRDQHEVLRVLLEHGAQARGWEAEQEAAVHGTCRLMLQQVRLLETLMAKALVEARETRGNDTFTLDVLSMVAKEYLQLDLPRLAAQAAAEASARECALGRFEQCVKSCKVALAVHPPLPSAAAVALTLKFSLEALREQASTHQTPSEALSEVSLLVRLIALHTAIKEEASEEEKCSQQEKIDPQKLTDHVAGSEASIGTAEGPEMPSDESMSDCDIVPMGQYCFTACFLKDRGWRHQAFPLDWSTTTFQVWCHMLRDNFTTLLAEKRFEGQKHPYNVLFFPDAAMFPHQTGWATDDVRRRVARLRASLDQDRVLGISFYSAGIQNCSQSLDEIVSDAIKVTVLEPGFRHILIVWLENCACSERVRWWQATSRVTVLRYAPRCPVNYWDEPRDHLEDMDQIAGLMMAAFPGVFRKDPAHDEEDHPDSPVSSEEDAKEHWDDPFDERPYWEDVNRREAEAIEARAVKDAKGAKPPSTRLYHPQERPMADELQDPETRIWVTLDGLDPRGILVRAGESLHSTVFKYRLTPGSRIKELGVVGNRLHYMKLSGDGPDWGWVSIEHDGRRLVGLEEDLAKGEANHRVLERDGGAVAAREKAAKVEANHRVLERDRGAVAAREKSAKGGRAQLSMDVYRQEPEQDTPSQQLQHGKQRVQRRQQLEQQQKMLERENSSWQQQSNKQPQTARQQKQEQTVLLERAVEEIKVSKTMVDIRSEKKVEEIKVSKTTVDIRSEKKVTEGAVGPKTVKADPAKGTEAKLEEDDRWPLVQLILGSTPAVPSQTANEGRLWVVTGLDSAHGIVVRTGESLGSKELRARLAAGTVVEELDLLGQRLHYKRIRGDGPDFGWVSVRARGKSLLESLSPDEWARAQAELRRKRTTVWL